MIDMAVFLVYVLVALPLIFNILREMKGKSKSASPRKWKFSIILCVFGWIMLSALLWVSSLYFDILWFRELGQEGRFFTIFKIKSLLALMGGVTTLVISLITAKRVHSLFAKNDAFSKEKPDNMMAMSVVFSVVLSIIFAIIFSAQWDTVMLYFNAEQSFGVADPIFGKDVSFYMFTLPFLQLIGKMLLGLLLAQLFLILAMLYVFDGRTREHGFIVAIVKYYMLRSMSSLFLPLLGLLTAVFAYLRYLAPYGYLFGYRGIFYGANYVDVTHRIGLNRILAVVLVLVAVAFFVAPFVRNVKKRIFTILVPSATVVAFMVVLAIVPAFSQSVTVKPNELELERQYIQWNIEFTQIAYNLDGVVIENYNPALDVNEQGSQNEKLDPRAVLAESETLKNIRLADTRALINFFRRSQEFRRYYDFSEVYEARYQINGEYRQVIIGVRELNQEFLDAAAKTWVNQRLKFTHGYGIVMIPVNEFEGGLPVLLMRDIPVVSLVEGYEVLRPEVYFGKRTNSFVIVNTTEDEFSYQISETIVNSRYSGKAGIEVGEKFSLRRFVIAQQTDGIRLYTSDAIKPDSKILMNRNVVQRVKKLAPFLKYDKEPYLVVTEEGRLVWMLDAYTTSDKFPYSAKIEGINYIRNSVKITVDAYDGTVNFYAFDENDPVLAAWRNIFPDMFKDKDEMPAGVRAHVKYPKDMLRIQAEIYSVYHMENVETFYKREDVYDFANEKYSSESEIDIRSGLPVYARTIRVEPYYVIMKLPGKEGQEFVLGVPFTPKGQIGRERLELIAWMVARSDGDNYGNIIVYRFPTHRLTPGPQQVESFIDSDAEMSAQMTLWDQKGSSVIRGNMITIPIAGTVLSVEPIYIQSDSSPIPRLQKVIVSIGEYVAWGDTLNEALNNLFTKMDSGYISLPDIPENIDQNTLSILIQQAIGYFENYLELQSQGRIVDAASELEKHYKILKQIKLLFYEKEEVPE